MRWTPTASAARHRRRPAQRLHHDFHPGTGGVLDCHRSRSSLDLVPAGATKGAGLRTLLAGPWPVWDVEVWTIGDSRLLDMHVADRTVACPGPPPEVTAACGNRGLHGRALYDWKGDRHE